jgi:hypothetical protein
MPEHGERLPPTPVSGNQIPESFPPLSKAFFSETAKLRHPEGREQDKEIHQNPYKINLSKKNLIS